MRAKSHRLLGQFLAEQYLINTPRRCVHAFLAGCTEPDKNPTTYLKGSLQHRWLRGHDYANAERYMSRIILRLERKRRWNLLDYYTLGKLIHYTADAFTAAHSESFDGDLFAHRSYECRLHRHFQARLTQRPNQCPYVHDSVMETIRNYHHQYRKYPASVRTDADYCIGVSSLIIKMLAAGKTHAAKTAVF